jgi:hypothetical protein
METFIMDHGWIIKRMVMEFKLGNVETNTKGSLKMIL